MKELSRKAALFHTGVAVIIVAVIIHTSSMQSIFILCSLNIQSIQDIQDLRYCEIGSIKTSKDSNDCYRMLSSHLSSNPAWHFLGDSQMGRMNFGVQLPNKYPYNISKTTTARARCGFLDYCQLKKPSKWMVQNASKTQGPFLHGLSHPFCSDLRNHDNYKVETENIGWNTPRYSEYLVVEYASDVEQQTNITNTTQQSVTLYMEKELKSYNISTSDSVCVVNTGVHDQHICVGKTETECLDIHTKNVQEYLRLLDHVCGNIVWLATTPVRGDLKEVQDNNRTVEWNKAVMSLLEKNYAEKSFYVDTWKRALNCTYLDNVHFEKPYYEDIADMFVRLIKY